MEGVGARLGRSSTRFGGPATVFSGPVRKWKKRWVHVSSFPSSNPSSGNTAAHLILFKWTPFSQTNNSSKGDSTPPPDEPPKKKFRYVPVSVIEEQNEDNAEKVEDEMKPSDASTAADPSTEDSGGNPDDNDVTISENQFVTGKVIGELPWFHWPFFVPKILRDGLNQRSHVNFRLQTRIKLDDKTLTEPIWI